MVLVRLGSCGGEGQNRTADTTIFSRVLYLLSYLARPPQDSVQLPLDAKTGAAAPVSIPWPFGLELLILGSV